MANAAKKLRSLPRLGFLGVGWIGRNRMEAIHKGGACEVTTVFEPSEEMRKGAKASIDTLQFSESYAGLLETDVDGIVIATPSAVHAQQSIQALEKGKAVFCQKPLGRNAKEVEAVISAAKKADRLLGVDLSYRHTAGMKMIFDLLQKHTIGKVYSIDLVFHNAYGPDKAWFYDPKLSGGGCVMDLGIHLVDLALWCMNFPVVTRVSSQLFSKGNRLQDREKEVEDFAIARIDLLDGPSVNLQCSWRISAGCDAIIEASFFGTEGGLSFKNVNGSFYDFQVDRYRGTSKEVLLQPPDEWGGRAAEDWARHLALNPCFDSNAENLMAVAEVLDRIYDSHFSSL